MIAASPFRIAALTATLAGLAACGLDAQARRGGPVMRALSTAGVALQHREELDLTEEQIVTLEAIRSESEAETAPLREEARETMRSGGGPRAGDGVMREIMGRLREALAPFNQRAEAVLTEEQRTKVDELRATRRRRGPPGDG